MLSYCACVIYAFFGRLAKVTTRLLTIVKHTNDKEIWLLSSVKTNIIRPKQKHFALLKYLGVEIYFSTQELEKGLDPQGKVTTFPCG